MEYPSEAVNYWSVDIPRLEADWHEGSGKELAGIAYWFEVFAQHLPAKMQLEAEEKIRLLRAISRKPFDYLEIRPEPTDLIAELILEAIRERAAVLAKIP